MVGLLGKKLGQTRIYTEDGRSVNVTIVQAGPNQVLQRKTTGKDGYEAVQLGFDGQKEHRLRLAKRWKPSSNTNRPHELLIPPAEAISILGEREYNRRMEASYEANKPDYEHKHFKPMLPVGTTSKESAKVEQEEETQTIIHAS